MALARYMYGDPARIYEQKQERECKGCLHEKRELVGEFVIMSCKKGKKHSDFGGRKCGLYKEVD